MANGINALSRGAIAAPTSLAVGGVNPLAAQNALVRTQQQQQQSRLNDLRLSEAERARENAILDRVGGAIANTTDEASFNRALAGVEERQGLQPGTLTGRFRFEDRDAILGEVQGAKAILAAQARQRLTPFQERSLALREQANMLRARELGIPLPGTGTQMAAAPGQPDGQPAATPVSTEQPPAPVEDPRTARIRRETRAREEEKARVKRPKMFRAARNALDNFREGGTVLSTAIQNARDILARNQTSLFGIPINTAAGFGALLRLIPETDAKALQGALRTIRARIGFDELQKLRQASPTGGAIGQVSDREQALLQSLQGNLDQELRPEQLLETLTNIEKARSDALRRLDEAFRSDFADEVGGQPVATPPSAPTGDEQQAGIGQPTTGTTQSGVNFRIVP